MNCRNTVDRWPKRAEILIEQLVELKPDVIGLQELRHFVPCQAKWIAREVGARTGAAHWLHTAYKTGLWWFWEGIAILSRHPFLERGTIALPGDRRVAVLARLRLPDGGVLDFYNLHAGGQREEKRAQVEAVLQWMAARPGGPQVLVGDFNATPTSPAVVFVQQSLRSVFAAVHGAEPARTVPTPLRGGAEAARGVVLDYIFVNEAIEVHDARVTFDRSPPDDPHLYPSDHFGLAATISIR